MVRARRRQAGRKRASSFYITPDNPRQGQPTSFYIIYQKSWEAQCNALQDIMI